MGVLFYKMQLKDLFLLPVLVATVSGQQCSNSVVTETCCYQHDCADGQPGDFLPDTGCDPVGCCQEWCQCFAGFAFKRDCGEGRVWNKEKQKCTQKWDVGACGATTTTPTTTTKSNTCKLHTTCVEDGYFPEGDCLPTFCTCYDGWGFVQQCMTPLKFDEIISGCNWEEQVPGCHPTTTTTTTASTTPMD